MERIVSTEDFKKFISSSNLSKRQLAKAIGISRNQLYMLEKGFCKMGDRTQKKFKRFLENDEFWNFEDLIKPNPMIIGNEKVERIVIYKKSDKSVVAMIDSENELVSNDYKVERVPFLERIRDESNRNPRYTL